MNAVSLQIPAELVEQIAERAAEIVAERAGAGAGGAGEWLTVAEAADHLRCSTGRVYQLVSARRIPFQKDGSRVLFRRSEVDAWVEEGGARCP
jgi:excisionase family DNA binding protein